MKKNLLLSLDPSKTCTGYVVYDPDENEILESGIFKVEPEDHKRKTDQYVEEADLYTHFLLDVFLKWGFNHIVTEYPHGSQSATASRALSMVNSIISAFSHLILYKKPITYLESDAKQGYFGKRDVSKEETREAMHKEYPDYKPALRGGDVVKYKDEAICDALLILHNHLNP